MVKPSGAEHGVRETTHAIPTVSRGPVEGNLDRLCCSERVEGRRNMGIASVRLGQVLAIILLCVAVLFGTAGTPARATPHPGQSLNVAIVGSPDMPGVGVLPTSGSPGELGDFVFANLAPGDVTSANLAAFDTVVLNVASTEMNCSTSTLSAGSKADLLSFVSARGKLLIYDSECAGGTGVDYSWLPSPFSTSNPGARGAMGTLAIAEDNTLSHRSPGDPHYVNAAELAAETDAVGDMNVMVIVNPGWCLDMQGTNVLNVTGATHAYSRYGAGLIVYNGLDLDYIDRTQSSGVNWLRKIWLQELQQPFNPDNLPCTTAVEEAHPIASQPHQDTPSSPNGTATQDPVNIAFGNFTHQHSDLFLPGRGLPLEFNRTYNSSRREENGPLGFGWTHNYNMRIMGATGAALPIGSTVQLIWSDGRQDDYLARGGGSFNGLPDIHNTLVQSPDATFTLTTQNQIRFGFAANGKLTSLADRNNNTTIISYHPTTGFLQRATDATGRIFDFQTDAQGRITQIDDQQLAGRFVRFIYNAAGDLERVEKPKDATTVVSTNFTYNLHRLTVMTDANNQPVTQNTYDSASRVTKQTDALSNVTCLYFGSGPTNTFCPAIPDPPTPAQTVVVNPRGYRTTYTFDGLSRLQTAKDANNGQTQVDYDEAGNILSVIDANGHATSFEYDTSGNVLERRQVHSDGSGTNDIVRTFTYTSSNDIDVATDPMGRMTDYDYDAASNVTSVTRRNAQGVPLATTSFERNSFGDVTLIRDPNQHETTFIYGPYGLLDAVLEPGSPPAKTDYFLDAAGRLFRVRDALANQTDYAYDFLNNLVEVRDETATVSDCNVTPYPNTGCTQHTYDNKGNRTSVKNARGKVTTSTYDEMGRLKSVTDALSDANGPRVTTFTYDAHGNLVAKTGPRRNTVGLRTTTYVYDELDRLEEIQYPDFHYNVTFQYDAVGNRTKMTDISGVTENLYDDLDRLERVCQFAAATTCAAGPRNEVKYAYDDIGNRTRITYPDPTKEVTYTYDAFNRMDTVTDWLTNITNYDYDSAGNLTQIAYPASTGITTTATYDTRDRLDVLTNSRGGSTLSSYDYTVDAIGNRSNVVEPGGISATYDYDDLYRLTEVEYNDATPQTDTYFYDSVGNRLSKNSTTYAYDDADQMTSAGGTPYVYERNGALTRFGPNILAANQANKFLLQDYDARYLRIGHCYDVNMDGAVVTSDITAVVAAFGAIEGQALYDPRMDVNENGPDGAILIGDITRVVAQFGDICPDTGHFIYNGDGLRVQKRARPAPGQTLQVTNFVWDLGSAVPNILQETTGNQTTYYVYGLDLISSVTGTPAAPTYYLYDGLGSTTGLANATGAVIDTYRYDVFGAMRSHTGTSAQLYKFTGELEDVGVVGSPYYLRSRYYDSSTGRFLSRDMWPGVIGQPASQNRYTYVLNNPANYIDPTGLHCSVRHPHHAHDCAVDAFDWTIDATYDARSPVTRALAETLWSTSLGDVVLKEGGVRMLTNCLLACRYLLDWLDQNAITIGRTIFATGDFQGVEGERLLQHELGHVRQYEILGDGFLVTYFGPAAAGAVYGCIGEGDYSYDCLHDMNFLEALAD